MNDLKFTTAGDYMKMNERIEELALQANLKLNELSDDTFIPLEKFAELIVQECLNICEDMGDNGMDGHYCADKISKTFLR